MRRSGNPYMMPGKANTGVQNGQNPTQVFINNFNQFKQTLNGDPSQIGPEYIQRLMDSGQMSQDQWSAIMQQANQLRGLLPS